MLLSFTLRRIEQQQGSECEGFLIVERVVQNWGCWLIMDAGGLWAMSMRPLHVDVRFAALRAGSNRAARSLRDRTPGTRFAVSFSMNILQKRLFGIF